MIITIKFLRTFGIFFFFLFCTFLLVFSVRGLPGNPLVSQLRTDAWRDNGPFELSPERGRFALLYSVLEDKSFSFSKDLAFFTQPDVAYMDGRYVSLFAPGLSFVVMPGYLIGKYFGVSQVGTFFVVSLFAICNVFLIRLISIRLGAHSFAATIAGFSFLFASPSFAYAVNLYQHHVSTFLILLSCYLLIRFNNFWSLSLIWIICVFSVVIDYPNFFMLLPIGIFALSRLFFIDTANEGAINITFSLVRLLTFVSVILPIAFFCWINVMSYGKPFQLAGAIERPIKINPDGTPVLRSVQIKSESLAQNVSKESMEGNKNFIAFFINRNIMNGLYIHLLSPDRGMLVYTPIMFFSLIGIYFAWRIRTPFFTLLIAIIGFNILLYSMWGDPYGGWAFGSRYLIPSYSILSLFIAIALTKLRKNIYFLLIFFIVLAYSLSVNTLGAITSSANPPQIEAAALEKLSGRKEEFTYMRNVLFLNSGKSKSFMFQSFAHRYISAWNYYSLLTFLSIGMAAYLVISLKITKQTNNI